MKRSKHVALWITGSLALTGCHQTPAGDWAWGIQPSVSGTNNGPNGSGGWWHSYGGGGNSGGFWGGEEGAERGGFGGHGFGGEGFGE